MSPLSYDVDVPYASSVRFEPNVLARLQFFVQAHPGLSLAAATNLLVDEALRSAAHPLITFVDGPSGRRARLAGGPDVDRVIRALLSTQEAEPARSIDEILALVSETAGIPAYAVQAAVEYWAEFPDEIDERIEEGGTAESEPPEQWTSAPELVE